MIVILSPSKTMDMTGAVNLNDKNYSNETISLINKLKELSPETLSKLMKIKGKTLEAVVNIYKNIDSAPFKKAIEAYSGFVFKEIKLNNYSAEEKEFLDKHFLILSALYGVLTADSHIKEYRLDMTNKVFSDKTSYQYWKSSMNSSLIAAMNKNNDDVLINLASNEFSKIIDRKNFPFQIIDIDFKEEKNGKFKSISTYAKKARGLMSNFIIVNQIEDAQNLIKFNDEGYSFNRDLSNDNNYVFTRLGGK